MANAIHLTLLALVWIAVITSVALWSKFLVQCALGKSHFRDLVPAEPREQPFWTLADFLFAFGALLFGLVILSSLFVPQDAPLGPENDVPPEPSLERLVGGIAANSLAGVFAVIVTLAWLSLLHPRAIPRLGLVPKSRDIRLGFRTALWILPPVGLISLLVSLLVPYEHPVLDTLAESPTILLFAGMFVGTAIVAPLVEEFLFRVILQGSLERIADRSETVAEAVPAKTTETYLEPAQPSTELGNAYRPPREESTNLEDTANHIVARWIPTRYWPMIVTSVVFAWLHKDQGAAPIPLFVLSLGLGYLYRQTGRITAPLIVHMVLNAITLCTEFSRLLAE